MRADAVRNRRSVLAAADRLFAEAPTPAAVSMDDVAAAAGVGKGTLFRRFGDREGLIRAVFDEKTRELRNAIDSGQQPFGSSTPPWNRLSAFLDTIVTVKLENRHLSLALEGGDRGGLYLGPHYAWTHTLVSETVYELLHAATPPSRKPSRDRHSRLVSQANWLSHCLLAMTRADFIEHVMTHEKLSEQDLRANIAVLPHRLIPKPA
jgi:AcrR family transcriptional regulator